MQIKDLKPKQGNVDIIVDIVDVGTVREFQKFGKPGKVANAIAKDETGDIKFTLWNEDIEKIKAGDKVHIINGYVNEWQGEMQLTTGRMGKMEIVGKADIEPAKQDSQPASKPMNDDSSEESYDEPAVEEDIEDSNDDEI